MAVVAGHGKTPACRRWPSPAGHLSYLLAVWPRSSLAINSRRLVSFSVIRAGQTLCALYRGSIRRISYLNSRSFFSGQSTLLDSPTRHRGLVYSVSFCLLTLTLRSVSLQMSASLHWPADALITIKTLKKQKIENLPVPRNHDCRILHTWHSFKHLQLSGTVHHSEHYTRRINTAWSSWPSFILIEQCKWW